MAWGWGQCEESWLNSCPSTGVFSEFEGTSALNWPECILSYLSNGNSLEDIYDYWIKNRYLTGAYVALPSNNPPWPQTHPNTISCTVTELQYLSIFGYCACTGIFDKNHGYGDDMNGSGYTSFLSDEGGGGGCCRYAGYGCYVEGFCDCNTPPPMPNSSNSGAIFSDFEDTELHLIGMML